MEYTLRIREIREGRGLTQRQVAKDVQVSPGAVAKWETGVNVPTMENLMALASLFDCTMDTLCGRESPGAAQADAAS